MQPAALTATGLLVAALTLPSCHIEPAASSEPSGHLGTIAMSVEHPLGPVGAIDRTQLLVAYYMSAHHADDLEALTALRDAAEGDDRAAIEHAGQSMQSLAHRQLAGDEPLYAVLGRLDPQVRAVMHDRGLSRVVLVDIQSDHLDVTDDLVARIEPARD
ncbi:MAG: hypothetical protein AAGI30_01815 [Planctomycetota bacterium]